MNNDKALQIVKRPNLTKAQKSLFALICDKLKTDEKILYNEAEEIWVKKVCREVRNGVPHYYNYYKDRYEEDGEVKFKGGYEPLPEQWIVQRVLLWLTSNIGSLVLKGYLEVIPQIELKQLKQQL